MVGHGFFQWFFWFFLQWFFGFFGGLLVKKTMTKLMTNKPVTKNTTEKKTKKPQTHDQHTGHGFFSVVFLGWVKHSSMLIRYPDRQKGWWV
jgi:hypothetical protein